MSDYEGSGPAEAFQSEEDSADYRMDFSEERSTHDSQPSAQDTPQGDQQVPNQEGLPEQEGGRSPMDETSVASAEGDMMEQEQELISREPDERVDDTSAVVPSPHVNEEMEASSAPAPMSLDPVEASVDDSVPTASKPSEESGNAVPEDSTEAEKATEASSEATANDKVPDDQSAENVGKSTSEAEMDATEKSTGEADKDVAEEGTEGKKTNEDDSKEDGAKEQEVPETTADQRDSEKGNEKNAESTENGNEKEVDSTKPSENGNDPDAGTDGKDPSTDAGTDAGSVSTDAEKEEEDIEVKTCQICDKSFTGMISLVSHCAMMHSTVCPYCWKELKKKEARKAHMAAMHSFTCNICLTMFRSEQAYKTHVDMHSETTQKIHWECKKCYKVLTTEKMKDKHVSKFPDHELERYEETVPKHPGLGMRTQRKRKMTYKLEALLEDDTIRCQKCWLDFGDAPALKTHQRRQKQRKVPTECSGCDEEFLSECELFCHMKMEHTEFFDSDEEPERREPAPKAHRPASPKLIIKAEPHFDAGNYLLSEMSEQLSPFTPDDERRSANDDPISNGAGKEPDDAGGKDQDQSQKEGSGEGVEKEVSKETEDGVEASKETDVSKEGQEKMAPKETEASGETTVEGSAANETGEKDADSTPKVESEERGSDDPISKDNATASENANTADPISREDNIQSGNEEEAAATEMEADPITDAKEKESVVQEDREEEMDTDPFLDEATPRGNVIEDEEMPEATAEKPLEDPPLSTTDEPSDKGLETGKESEVDEEPFENVQEPSEAAVSGEAREGNADRNVQSMAQGQFGMQYD